MPRRRSRKSPITPDDVMALADKAVYEVSNALKEDDWQTAALSALGFIPVAGDAAKRGIKSASKWADQGGKPTGAVAQRPRDMADVPMQGRKQGLDEQFLEQHGYPRYDGVGPRPQNQPYFEYNQDGVTAYTPVVGAGGKTGMEQKTFNNPTLKQLRDWMGY